MGKIKQYQASERFLVPGDEWVCDGKKTCTTPMCQGERGMSNTFRRKGAISLCFSKEEQTHAAIWGRSNFQRKKSRINLIIGKARPLSRSDAKRRWGALLRYISARLVPAPGELRVAAGGEAEATQTARCG